MSAKKRVFLFLQGPITPFLQQVADGLAQQGHRVLRVNFCFGDWLFWRRPGAVSFRGRLSQWPAFIGDFLDREQVTDMVLLGEQRDYHKIAIDAARRRGAQVVVTDFGYLRADWITLERDGMSARSQFPRDAATLRKLADGLPEVDLSPRYRDSFFTQALWDMSYHLGNVLFGPLYPFYHSNQIYHPVPVYLGTGWHLLRTRLAAAKTRAFVDGLGAKRSPYFLFPLQMQNDFQIRAYSRYANQQEAIDEVIGSFARHAAADACLLVKVHPLDPYLVDWRGYVRQQARQFNLGQRVRFMDGGALKPLLEHAQGVVTINSTVGIWTLLAGRPLIALGSAVYGVDGLVHGGPLDSFWQKPQAPDLALRDAFVKVLAATIQVRGVYYQAEGLAAAVAETVARLHTNTINQPLKPS